MSEQKVLIASKNHVKLLAAEDALKIFSQNSFRVELSDQKISSGIADQPMSLTESATGAINRLVQIRKTGGYAFYIAIEGGVYSVDTPAGTFWYESACAAVVGDNPSQTPSVAFGPAYPVPKHIARHLHDGNDLNEAMELETGIAKIGNAGGFNGWLTDDNLDRRSSSGQAVLLALYGLQHER